MQEALDSMLGLSGSGVVVVVVGAVAVLIVLGLVFGRRKKKPSSLIDAKRLVDLSALPLPDDGPQPLKVQGLPGRLGVVVFAPLGRLKTPAASETFAVLNTVVPGLGKVFRRDEPLVITWPNQVSVTGFANILARHVHVPGQDLTETSWCLLVGKTKRPDGLLLVDLAVAMQAPHRLGVIRLADEMQWLQFVQVDPQVG